jgi:hypothetical protein
MTSNFSLSISKLWAYEIGINQQVLSTNFSGQALAISCCTGLCCEGYGRAFTTQVAFVLLCLIHKLGIKLYLSRSV